jgi:hypothetical protein
MLEKANAVRREATRKLEYGLPPGNDQRLTWTPLLRALIQRIVASIEPRYPSCPGIQGRNNAVIIAHGLRRFPI